MTASVYTKPAHSPNEDNFIVDEKLKLFAVFDGMGGYEGGSIASKIAAATIWNSIKDETYKNKKIKTNLLLETSLLSAAKKIEEDGKARGRPYQGTTATIALITDTKLTVANVGDSRCYGLTKGGELKRLTKDHSIVEDLVQNHRISASLAQKIDQATKSEDLNNEELFIFNQRNIVTAALSQEFKDTDIYLNEVELSEFKMLALTTDGVHDNITDNDIKTLLMGSRVGGSAAKNLVEFAHEVSLQNTLRSKPDDITAVIIDL